MDNYDGTPIRYYPNWALAADRSFKRLWDELQWVRHTNVPRREYYCNTNDVPYTYGQGRGVRTYDTQPWHEEILGIKDHLHAGGFGPYEVCFLNGYEDGSDQLGWHADDSPEMDDKRTIAIVTFGAEREIWFKRQNAEIDRCLKQYVTEEFHNDEPLLAELRPRFAQVTKLRLGHGSLCIMEAGMQDTHYHRIPKSDRQNCGPRISLTFRGYVNHNVS